jgi:hypothetical protein
MMRSVRPTFKGYRPFGYSYFPVPSLGSNNPITIRLNTRTKAWNREVSEASMICLARRHFTAARWYLLVRDGPDSRRVLVSGTSDGCVRHLPMGHKIRRKREYEVQLAHGFKQSPTRTPSSPIATREAFLRFLMLLQSKRFPWTWGSGIRGKRRWVGSAQNTVPAGVPQVQPLPLTNLEAYHADLLDVWTAELTVSRLGLSQISPSLQAAVVLEDQTEPVRITTVICTRTAARGRRAVKLCRSPSIHPPIYPHPHHQLLLAGSPAGNTCPTFPGSVLAPWARALLFKIIYPARPIIPAFYDHHH